MPNRHFFNRFARSHSPKRKGKARQFAKEKVQTESTFAPSFPNGMPEPYLWKVIHKDHPSSENQGSSRGDGDDAQGAISKDESVFKMGNLFEGLSDDSEFRMLMAQGLKDPSLASDIKDSSPDLKDDSLDLDVIQRMEDPSLILEIKNKPSNENWSGIIKIAGAQKQQAESSPAFLNIPLAGRSKTPLPPQQGFSSTVQRPENPYSNIEEINHHSTGPGRLERSKFPSGRRSRLLPDDPEATAILSRVQSRTKRAMQNCLERTKAAIRARPKSVRNSVLVRSAASLRLLASHRNRYGRHLLPGLVINGEYRLYRRPKPPLKSLMSDDGSGLHHPLLIPRIVITPPPPDDEEGRTNVVVDFNSLLSINSPSSTGTTVKDPVVSEAAEISAEEPFDQKLTRLMRMYIVNAQVRNELRREICKTFAEEKGTPAAVIVSVPSP